jgi:GTPase SAR1 family protein
MTDPQAKFIDIKAEQVNINVTKMFKELFDVTNKKISKKVASQAIDKLNEFQKDVSQIPEGLFGYEVNWR